MFEEDELWLELSNSEEALMSIWRIIKKQSGYLNDSQISTIYNNISELSDILDRLLRLDCYYEDKRTLDMLKKFLQQGEECIGLIRDAKLKQTMTRLLNILKKYLTGIGHYQPSYDKYPYKGTDKNKTIRYNETPTFFQIANEIREEIKRGKARNTVKLSEIRDRAENLANSLILSYHLRRMLINKKLEELRRNA